MGRQDDEVEQQIRALSKKIRARGSSEGKISTTPPVSAFRRPTPIDMRKRSRTNKKVTLLEKITIIHQAVVLQYKHADIAKEHRISPQYVGYLAKKAEKSSRFIDELRSERDKKEDQRQQIAEKIVEMNKKDEFIDSAAHVQKVLKLGDSGPPKTCLIRSVLKKDLGMRYKKVSPIAWTANSFRNLILRQQFALAFLEIDLTKKVVLNVDETWIGMSDFRRRKWCQHRHTNSVPQLQMLPRISMICGLDTSGEIYVSIAQANSNS